MRRCTVLRVFTRDGLGGNPLGVVDDLAGLDGPAMQRIATDLGFSETIFLDRSDVRAPTVRIHTPATELPFAGHPLVGAGWFLSREGAEPEMLRCAAGDVAVRVDPDVTWIRPSWSFPVEPVRPDLGGWAHPMEAAEASMPIPYVVARLRDPEAVAAVRAPAPVDHLLVWAWIDPHRTVRARFFASGAGVPEDPATGSAAFALAAVLGSDAGDFDIHQGEELGSPSLLMVRWRGGGPEVGGRVVFDGERSVP